jgi:mono/diheme cytochrome c family protein
MKQAWWRTGPPIKHTEPVRRPTVAQLLRQGAVLLIGAALWGGCFLILLGATSASNVAFVAEQGTPERKATASTASIVATTRTPIASVTATRAVNATATVSISATATATQTPTAANTPTPKAATATLAATSAATGTVSFARDIQPIFDQVCVKCHGGEKTQKNLVLKSYNDLMQGSEDGPVIEPGNPGTSLLIDMIVKGKMPKNGPKLLPKQIQVIVDWVTAGAPDN